MYKILLVDDDAVHLQSMERMLSNRGMEVVSVNSAARALMMAKEQGFHCIISDVVMPELGGIDLLTELDKIHCFTPIIMLSGQSSISHAVEALKKGAFDFLEKPVEVDRLLITIKNAAEKQKLGTEKAELLSQLDSVSTMIGESASFMYLLNQIYACAATDVKVLIMGESGVGKELVARALHYRSKRNGNPFVKINCAAIPGDLLESELFGHKKGAYTGADRDYDGKIFKADGGTLFLDEIGDLDLKLQAKLLRVLQDFELDALGSNKTVKVDVRVVCASNKNLEQMVSEGSFRRDLMHRINTVRVNVPSLRERKDDIPLLARYFLRQFAESYNKRLIDFSPQVINILTEHNWPGNVRELKNVIENIAVFTQNSIITPKDILSILGIDDNQETGSGEITSINEARDNFERDFILSHLEKNGWKMSNTAQKLGIDRSALFKKMRKLGIKKDP